MARDKNVLIVDDSRYARLMLRKFFNVLRPAWVVSEAKDAKSALLLFGQIKPDAAVLDFNMPGMDGLELAQLLKSQAKMIDLFMFTANTQQTMKDQVQAAGIVYLAKPITEDKVRQIVGVLDVH